MTTRPRLTPAIADVRRAVRTALVSLAAQPPTESLTLFGTRHPAREGDRVPNRVRSPEASGEGGGAERAADVLVALSGGADSLALAAATAFEAPRAGLTAGAVIVDHGLQEASADVAAAAAKQARRLGLDPVIIQRVTVGTGGGPEAAARTARYEALAAAAAETGAHAILIAHTLDDQAETVLLGLARGSGATSLQGMAASSHVGGVTYLRPLLGIGRATTVAFCADSRLEPWHDPHNVDPAYTRVRVRREVMPVLERELGPGIADALARTAEQLREDAEALDHFASELIEDLAEHAEAGLSLSVTGLASNPPALRQRIIRLAVAAEFGVALSRTHTLAASRLVTDWRGQKSAELPGVRVVREGGLLVFSARGTDPEPPSAAQRAKE